MAAEQITLKWRDLVVGAVPLEIDKVNFTVYEVIGAMNVPGHSIHKYEARMPNGAEAAEFSGITGASIMGLDYGDCETTATIRWDGGPIVGVYRVTPSSNQNFFVNREVNIVQVSVRASEGENNYLDYSKNDKMIQDPQNSRMIISANPEPAMLAQLRVTSIEGPAVRGTTRGVRFIEVGFIQNAVFTSIHADYDGFATPQRRYSNIEGTTVLLDCYTDNPNASTPPWSDSKNILGSRGIYYGVDPVTVPIVNIDFNTKDTPRQLATDTMPLTIVVNGIQVTKYPSEFGIRMDFNLYLAVRTKEQSLDSDKVYTQRAKASWYFNGSGKVTNTIWSNADAGNSGDKFFTVITSGAVVPVTTGMLVNVAGNPPNSVWSTKNK